MLYDAAASIKLSILTYYIKLIFIEKEAPALVFSWPLSEIFNYNFFGVFMDVNFAWYYSEAAIHGIPEKRDLRPWEDPGPYGDSELFDDPRKTQDLIN